MSDIILYGFPGSSYTWSARLICAEKGVSHDLEGVELGSEAHRRLHPFCKIPVMKHGDLVLHETAAICRYIDEQFDGPALQPADPAARALMDQWNSSIVDYYYDCCIRRIVIQRLLVPQRGGTPDEAMIAEAVPQAKHALSITNDALTEAPYLVGDAPSIADFLLTPIVFYSKQVGEAAETVDGLDGLEDWLGRMQARPSFAATAPEW